MMLFDSAGLGYSVKEGKVYVHYSKKAADGTMSYGAGSEIDWPFRYPAANDATRERNEIITALLVTEQLEGRH